MSILELSWLQFSADEWWALATLLVTILTVALAGVHLFLRRLSLLGDALSHAVLPGVIGAVILVGSLSSSVVLVGALVAAVASIGVLWSFRRAGLAHDAALGVTFTTFFALGVLGIPYVASGIDVDLHCLLYGSLELAPFDTVVINGQEFPRAFISGCVTLLSLVAISVLFRRILTLDAFEPQRAALTFSHYLTWCADLAFLLTASAAIVNSFFAVGAVATTGALAMPVVIARTVSRRLSTLWIVTTSAAIVIAVAGYTAAILFDIPVAGSLTVTGMLMVILVVALAPHTGLLARAFGAFQLRLGISIDDHLGDLFRRGENPAYIPAPRRMGATFAMWVYGFITRDGKLTWKGASRAASIVRAHRLWEEFLARELKLKPDHVHESSHRMEHFINSKVSETLAETLQSDADPHGKPIPK